MTLLVLFISTCSNESRKNNGCSKFSNEVYLTEDLEKYDFDLTEMLEYYLKKFDGVSIKEDKIESYQLMHYSTHNYGRLIKIERNTKGAKMTVKCIENLEAGYYCTEAEILIDISDWHTLQSMIYEFNYWTENQIEINTGYLDGYAYFLEGKRPQAKECGKKHYNFAVRINPEYDKIAALCKEIISFEEMITNRMNIN